MPKHRAPGVIPTAGRYLATLAYVSAGVAVSIIFIAIAIWPVATRVVAAIPEITNGVNR